MRDKNRIRPFCEKFAELWEQKPDLRFGQIISALPRYKEKLDDVFYLEEDEMMEVIQRFFSSKGKKADKSDEDKRSELEIKWQELMETLQCNEFDTQSFKRLFADTWQYFIDSISASHGIDPGNITIISCISAFCWYDDYPADTNEWDFDACIRVAEALLSGLGSPLRGGYRGNFYNGYITVNEFRRATYELHISEFDGYFDELAEMYRKNAEEDEE